MRNATGLETCVVLVTITISFILLVIGVIFGGIYLTDLCIHYTEARVAVGVVVAMFLTYGWYLLYNRKPG